MARVFLHCSLNISRSLVEMMEEYGQKMQDKYGIEVKIKTQPHRPDEESLFKSDFEKSQLPDLIVGHVNDFAVLPKGFLEEHFRSLPERFPIKKNLADIGFKDPQGYFHPFVIIPFAIFYNKNLLDEKDIPQSWQDLLDPKWSKKVRMPDDFRMVSKIVRTFMEANYPDRFENFKDNVIHSKSPIDVVHAVDRGEYPIGITNIAFARISRNKNTRLIWPDDGFFCMPQVMVWSKYADNRLLEMGDFLMSPQVQEYLALQGFIPVSPDIDEPQLFADKDYKLHWKNWDYYLKIIRETKGV
jgi:spermidine/putrescine-binding protein